MIFRAMAFILLSILSQNAVSKISWLRCILGQVRPPASAAFSDLSKITNLSVIQKQALHEYQFNMAFRSYVRKHGNFSKNWAGLQKKLPSDYKLLSKLHASFKGEDISQMWKHDKDFKNFVFEIFPVMSKKTTSKNLSKKILASLNNPEQAKALLSNPHIRKAVRAELGLNWGIQIDKSLENLGDIITAKYIRNLLSSETKALEQLTHDIEALGFKSEKHLRKLETIIKDKKVLETLKNYFSKNQRKIDQYIESLKSSPESLDVVLAQAYRHKARPSFFSVQWFKDFHFVKKPASSFNQYVNDIYQQPSRLIFAPHDPNDLQKIEGLAKPLMALPHYLSHPVAQTFGLRRQLAAPVSIPLGILSYSWARHHFVDKKKNERFQVNLKNIESLNELADIHLKLLAGQISLNNAVKAAEQRGEDLALLRDSFVNHYNSPDPNAFFSSEGIEGTTFWQPMKDLYNSDFFQSKKDYTDLKNIYSNYLYTIFKQRKINEKLYSDPQKQQEVNDLQRNQILKQVLQVIENKFSAKYGPEKTLALTGFKLMVPTSELKDLNQIIQKQNNYELQKIRGLYFSTYPLIDFELLINSRDLKIGKLASNMSLFDGLTSFLGVSNEEKITIMTLVNKVHKSQSQEMKKQESLKLLQYLSSLGKIPENLFPYILDGIHKPVLLDEPISISLNGKNKTLYSFDDIILLTSIVDQAPFLLNFTHTQEKMISHSKAYRFVLEKVSEGELFTSGSKELSMLNSSNIESWKQNFDQDKKGKVKFEINDEDFTMEGLDLYLNKSYLLTSKSKLQKAQEEREESFSQLYQDFETSGNKNLSTILSMNKIWGPLKSMRTRLFKSEEDYAKLLDIYSNYYGDLYSLYASVKAEDSALSPKQVIQLYGNEIKNKYLALIEEHFSKTYSAEEIFIMSGQKSLIPQHDSLKLLEIISSKDEYMKKRLEKLPDNFESYYEAKKLIALWDYRQRNSSLNGSLLNTLSTHFELEKDHLATVENYLHKIFFSQSQNQQNKFIGELRLFLNENSKTPESLQHQLLEAYMPSIPLEQVIEFNQYQGNPPLQISSYEQLAALSFTESSLQIPLLTEEGVTVSSQQYLFRYPSKKQAMMDLVLKETSQYAKIRAYFPKYSKPLSLEEAASLATKTDFLKNISDSDDLTDKQKIMYILKKIQLEQLFYNIKKVPFPSDLDLNSKQNKTWQDYLRFKRYTSDKLEKQIFSE
jgi:hypothetical protein